MKFRFYIAHAMDGEVVGTNDEKVAKEFALSDENFVIDAEGYWMLSDTDSQDIAEQTTYKFD